MAKTSIPLYIQREKEIFKLQIGEKVDDPEYGVLLGNNGLFLLDTNVGFRLIKKITDNIPGLGFVTEKNSFYYPPIPFDVYLKALTFFKQIYTKYKSEGLMLLTLHRDAPLSGQQYKIRIPKQVVSGGKVDYDKGIKEINANLENEEFLAASIHSHPSFGASQSGIDHGDEIKFDGIHVTLGMIEKDPPEVHSRISLAGQIFSNIKEALIITSPSYPAIIIPDEWIEQVEEQKFSPGIGYEGSNFFLERKGKQTGLIKTTKEIWDSMKPKDVINQRNATKLTLIQVPICA